MPIYEYECEQCGVRFERLQRMADESLKECPECTGHVHRVMQPVGVIFKGSGFYVTDNRGKSSTGIPASKRGEQEGSTGSGGSSESSSAPATSSSAEKAEKADKSSAKTTKETTVSKSE